jgi:hypothetical protein
MATYLVSNIFWDTDNLTLEECSLPPAHTVQKVEVDNDWDSVVDALSDHFGFCIHGCQVHSADTHFVLYHGVIHSPKHGSHTVMHGTDKERVEFETAKRYRGITDHEDDEADMDATYTVYELVVAISGAASQSTPQWYKDAIDVLPTRELAEEMVDDWDDLESLVAIAKESFEKDFDNPKYYLDAIYQLYDYELADEALPKKLSALANRQTPLFYEQHPKLLVVDYLKHKNQL